MQIYIFNLLNKEYLIKNMIQKTNKIKIFNHKKPKDTEMKKPKDFQTLFL